MDAKWMQEKKLYAPSWLIIGISIVLMVVVILMGIANFQLEKKHTESMLMAKGEALLWSFEAGIRSGIIGTPGNQARLQVLLEETVAQSGISYIALIDKNGRILAHSDKRKVGVIASEYIPGPSFPVAEEPRLRRVEGQAGTTIFEVFKKFLPTSLHQEDVKETIPDKASTPAPGVQGGIAEVQALPLQIGNAIVIGMDVKPFEEAMSKGVRNSTILTGMIFLLALTGVVSLFWVQTNLHSRKQLRDISAFASEIVRNLPVGMVVVGDNGRIRFINEVACSLLTLQPKNAEGVLAQEVLPESLLQLREKLSHEKPVVDTELSLAGKENSSIPVHVGTTNIVGEDGQYIGFMFILRDLSELRQLEVKIRQREKLAAIGNLAAGIAHEVRNPLSSIKGYVTYLGSLFAAESENRKIAGITADEVDRVNRVISELLEFARPADLKLVQTDVHTLIDHALEVVAQEADYAGVKIIRQFGQQLPQALLDPDRMTQVLLNVLINAIQAMGHGGSLSVTAGQEDKMLVIVVSDTGGGISAEDQAHMFNPYFTTKKSGTGLGMAIVHKIIENHGGSVDVCSQEGVGTSISIRIPSFA